MAKKRPELMHSSQLDERMRRGDAQARGRDKANQVLLNLLSAAGFIALIVTLLAAAGVGVNIGIDGQVYLLAGVGLLFLGNSYIFNTIRWRAMRGHTGKKILEKWKADLQLTIVSIAALLTVVLVAIIELLALLVFLGVMDAGRAGASFASNFVLFQIIILLVYLAAIFARQTHLSSYEPGDGAKMAAHAFSAMGALGMILGALLASGQLQKAGILSDISVTQSVYVVTLGVGLDFIAMRIRLRLPSLWSHFRGALETARRANPAMKEVLRKRAQTTYVAATIFVVLSMALAAVLTTGNVALSSQRANLALVTFYVGTAVILLGVVGVRAFQSTMLKERAIDDADDLSRLVGQKRRSPEEIFRMAVYAMTGFLAFVFLLGALFVGMDRTAVPKTYATDLFVVALFFAGGPYGYFFNKERKRVEAIDEKFPDFLRDIAESARAGMTLPRALVTASRGTYGALTEDIVHMANQVEWGVEFSEALERFAARAKTPLIDRTVALVVEAQRAGGNVVDILTAASDDAREIKQIVAERNEQMSMYSVVVYIAYFVFIAVVLVLAAQFIPAFKDAVGAASGQQVGGLTFKDFDPEEFNTLFFHAAIVQAIGGGLVGGVLTRGHPVAGFNSIMVMIAAAWLSFRVIVGAL